MFNVGPLELIVVLIIALIVLGPQRLPDVARSVGRGMREFRSALDRPDDDEYDEPEPERERVDELEGEADDVSEPVAEEGGEPAAEEPVAEEDDAEPASPGYQKDADSSEPSSSSRDLV